MQLKLNLNKTIQQSANEYFERAKKARKKAEKAQETVNRFKKEVEQLEKKQGDFEQEQKEKTQKITRKQEWYEKFRWFISSEGFLCIGGRDATTNEIVIKKHMDKNDLVFHTEAPGSPFFVVKTNGKTPGEKTIQEAADATITFSKAWKLGLGTTEAYYVTPDQVSKQAQSGEYMPKGGFMIRGKRTYVPGKINLAIGNYDETAMAGPEEAIKKNCTGFIVVKQGKGKPSDCAKKIAKQLKLPIDDTLRSLPAGTCEV
ncbi:hypothetical protein COV18_07600 [Candidatus Woesearchaeota archaeon CG10_big_fil_rev_8_21_14_0_10_37_12]|nr:MAG: hypothetical protein COV18_07600 [Candidatus Woesearchaeota archaeon CG10_big_fil_rev_8_21_14_0_10_37_12]